MSASNFPAYHNQLLSILPEASRQLISPELEALSLPKGFVMASTDERMNFVYFLESGIGSVILKADKGHMAEAGMFGREGFSPTAAAVGGDTSIYDIVMQSPGEGYRLDTATFAALIDQDRNLERILLRFIHVFAGQVAYTALANAGYTLDVKLTRWLLMCHDRVDGDEFRLTHEYISLMLGARRATVTAAIHDLEGRGFIKAERSLLRIKDRDAMEAFAGEAYGKPEELYRMLLKRPKANGHAEEGGAVSALN
jgi:CRP-like cAMP-binding protein